MNLVIWRFSRKRRRLSSLSSEYSLRIGTNGRWSVMRLKALDELPTFFYGPDGC
jgi:hypothetical protein